MSELAVSELLVVFHHCYSSVPFVFFAILDRAIDIAATVLAASAPLLTQTTMDNTNVVRAQLLKIGNVLDKAMTQWVQHTTRVHNEWQQHSNDPRMLTQTTFDLNDATISSALARLDAVASHLKHRGNMLEAHGFMPNEECSIEVLLLDAMSESPIGTETYQNRFAAAVIAVEYKVGQMHVRLAHGERLATTMLYNLLGDLDKLHNAKRRGDFAARCANGDIEREVNLLMTAMASRRLEMKRQTLIVEYFRPS